MAVSKLLRVSTLLGLACLSTVSGLATPKRQADQDAKILILGGGVTGVIAARTFHEQGYDNFVIIEARDELGGRMMSHTFGAPGKQYTVDVGANWVQGTQVGDGPKNPILTLVEKHNLTTQVSDYFGSLTTYDETGFVDYLDVFNAAADNYTALTVAAGERVPKGLVDATSRTGYSIVGSKPKDPHAQVSEYYQFDWEYAQTPEQTSWIASSWAQNFTYDAEAGGFGPENLLSLDQRGFKAIIQEEANEFLQPEQLLLNHTVRSIEYSASGVTVTFTDGSELSGDYALCTFSLGVLQNDDVVFEPKLPDWKEEAIQSMKMATYSIIFLQFPEKFWFDTQFAIYADTERGRYPVWQSLDIDGFVPGSGIMSVTVTGDFSERIEALPDSQVEREVVAVLHSMYPNQRIPDPEAFYYQRWFSDPLYRGSYSNWPASFFSEHHDNLKATVDQRLWFAGEATSMEWFGFLHGAYMEGLSVADSMVTCIQEGGCVGLEHVENVTNGRPYKI